jgi:hypothetical protein
MPPRRDKRSPLKVRVSHEASRLAGHNMADAFERLLPTIDRQMQPWPVPPPSGDRRGGGASEAHRPDQVGQTKRL